jgi:hypothetical protein
VVAEFRTSEERRRVVAEANQRWRDRHTPRAYAKQYPTVDPSHEDCIYAAGFLDGEGYLGSQRRGDSSYVGLRVAVAGRVVDPLTFLRERWGGRVGPHGKPQGNRKPAWQWTLTDRTLIAHLLTDTMSWMLVKRRQAELLVELAVMPKMVRGQADVDADGRRLTLHDTLRELNRRGI